ncbi:hypothetical protein NPIL_664751 [Nephila pilipes]|uniref:Uncharacterized protein n=1 Tax=Nephila pilipes TaxID=299642 RepID=A0A8X6PVU3_NEPPI|nr:hypothetical protein NPIL_664751 [Nephila pilipes]
MDDSCKQLSGCQCRKRKHEKDAENEKQAEALESLQKRVCSSQPVKIETNEANEDGTNFTPFDPDIEIVEIWSSTTIGVATASISKIQSKNQLPPHSENTEESETTHFSSIFTSDPSTWPDVVKDAEKRFLINKSSPSHLCDHEFLMESYERRFVLKKCKGKHNNDEIIVID